MEGAWQETVGDVSKVRLPEALDNKHMKAASKARTPAARMLADGCG